MQTKKRTLKDRVIPEYTDKIEQDDFVVYLNKKNLSAIGYKGRSAKKSFWYRFRSVEKMENYCLNWALETAKYFDKKKAEKEKTANIKASDHFSIGDIIYNCWGYEQTNIDYYQVVKVTDKKIRVKEIASTVKETGFMSGSTMPQKDNFIENGKEYLLSLRFYGDTVYITGGASYYSFQKWDGKEKSCSWYA